MLGLITNVINHFDVDFILPISYSDTNMERAHHRDAVLKEKFWFKTNCVHNPEGYWNSDLHESNYTRSAKEGAEIPPPEYQELYISEILNGKQGTGFKGIFSLIRKFMEIKKYSPDHVT